MRLLYCILALLSVPALASSQQPLYRHRPDLDPGFIGYGFRYDHVGDVFEMCEPIFWPSGGLVRPSPGSIILDRIHVKETLSNGFEVSSTDGYFGVDATYGVFKAGASLRVQSSAETRTDTGSFSVAWDRVIGPAFVDLANPAAYTLSPRAVDILANPQYSLQDRRRLWSLYFGDYFAVGTLAMASLDLKVARTHIDSYASLESMAEVRASYTGVASGSAAIASSAIEALSSDDLSVDLRMVGGTAPALPLLTNLGTPSGQAAFEAALNSAMAGASADVGLALLAADQFPGSPFISPLQVNTTFLDAQTTIVSQALRDLMEAYRFTAPPKFAQYLEDVMLPSGVNAADATKNAVDALELALRGAWYALVRYSQYPLLSRAANLASYVNVVAARRADLQNVLGVVRSLAVATVAGAQPTFTRRFINGDPARQWYVAEYEFRDVAIFERSDARALRVIAERLLTLTEYNVLCTSGCRLLPLDSLGSFVRTPGSMSGLENVSLQFSVRTYANVPFQAGEYVDLRFEDHLGRSVVTRIP